MRVLIATIGVFAHYAFVAVGVGLPLVEEDRSMPGTQPLPPLGESYVVLRRDGTFDPVWLAPGAFTAAKEVDTLRRRGQEGWLARCWRTPRGQVWFDPVPLVTVGRLTLDDYAAAGRALEYRCTVSAAPAVAGRVEAPEPAPAPLPLAI